SGCRAASRSPRRKRGARSRSRLPRRSASAFSKPRTASICSAARAWRAQCARRTIERGRDPQEFTLVAFGGNGPLFAAEMARSLQIGAVLVPPAPGVWSAIGLLEAEMEHHLVRTFLRPLDALAGGELERAVAQLEAEARALLAAQGHRDVSIE